MKGLAAVLIILILVLGALIALRMHRTSNRKKEEWRTLSNRATLAENTIRQISKELQTAKAAGMAPDLFVLDNMIEEYELDLASPNSKEIAR